MPDQEINFFNGYVCSGPLYIPKIGDAWSRSNNIEALVFVDMNSAEVFCDRSPVWTRVYAVAGENINVRPTKIKDLVAVIQPNKLKVTDIVYDKANNKQR